MAAVLSIARPLLFCARLDDGTHVRASATSDSTVMITNPAVSRSASKRGRMRRARYGIGRHQAGPVIPAAPTATSTVEDTATAMGSKPSGAEPVGMVPQLRPSTDARLHGEVHPPAPGQPVGRVEEQDVAVRSADRNEPLPRPDDRGEPDAPQDRLVRDGTPADRRVR